MVTSLIAGKAVPLWDRALRAAINEAVEVAPKSMPIRRLAVMNDEGQLYRHVIADGDDEFRLLLKCLESRGFGLRLSGSEIVASLDVAKASSPE